MVVVHKTISIEPVVGEKIEKLGRAFNTSKVCNDALKVALGITGIDEVQEMQRLKVIQREVKSLAEHHVILVRAIAIDERHKFGHQPKTLGEKLYFWGKVLDRSKKEILQEQLGLEKESTPAPPKEKEEF